VAKSAPRMPGPWSPSSGRFPVFRPLKGEAMIQPEHVEQAMERFGDFLRLGAHEQSHLQHQERGARLWESVGLTPELREQFYDYAVHYLGGFVDAQTLLMGVLFGLMAADAAGELPSTGALTESDLDRLLGG
jgi:hypothetical protein